MKTQVIEDLLKNIVQNLVDRPEQVRIKTLSGERCTIFEVSVDKSDVGKIIGKQGRMASSIRSIVTAISTKMGQRAQVEIIE